jgi:hypothetical protein
MKLPNGKRAELGDKLQNYVLTRITEEAVTKLAFSSRRSELREKDNTFCRTHCTKLPPIQRMQSRPGIRGSARHSRFDFRLQLRKAKQWFLAHGSFDMAKTFLDW